MKRIQIPLNEELTIQSNSPVISVKYDKNSKRVILDIDQQELSHKYLKDTGGDPHPQYLDMIRHKAMDHQYILDETDERYLPKYLNHIKYFFERFDVGIEPGLFGYTVPPVGNFEISNIVVATRSLPDGLKFDILFQGVSIFTDPVEETEFLVSSYGRSVVYKAMIPGHDAAIVGPGLLEIVILEASNVSDLMVRIEFV